MSNPAALLGRMGTEKCPLNLVTMRSLLILAREASRGMKSDRQLAGDWAESEWEEQSGAKQGLSTLEIKWVSSQRERRGGACLCLCLCCGDIFI